MYIKFFKILVYNLSLIFKKLALFLFVLQGLQNVYFRRKLKIKIYHETIFYFSGKKMKNKALHYWHIVGYGLALRSSYYCN